MSFSFAHDILDTKYQLSNLYEIRLGYTNNSGSKKVLKIDPWMVKSVNIPGTQNSTITLKYFHSKVHIPKKNLTYNDVTISIFDKENVEHHTWFEDLQKTFLNSNNVGRFAKSVEMSISILDRKDFKSTRQFVFTNLVIRNLSDLMLSIDGINPVEFNVTFAISDMESKNV